MQKLEFLGPAHFPNRKKNQFMSRFLLKNPRNFSYFD